MVWVCRSDQIGSGGAVWLDVTWRSAASRRARFPRFKFTDVHTVCCRLKYKGKLLGFSTKHDVRKNEEIMCVTVWYGHVRPIIQRPVRHELHIIIFICFRSYYKCFKSADKKQSLGAGWGDVNYCINFLMNSLTWIVCRCGSHTYTSGEMKAVQDCHERNPLTAEPGW